MELKSWKEKLLKGYIEAAKEILEDGNHWMTYKLLAEITNKVPIEKLEGSDLYKEIKDLATKATIQDYKNISELAREALDGGNPDGAIKLLEGYVSKKTRSVYGNVLIEKMNVFDNETLQGLWEKLTDLKSEAASYKNT